MLTMVTCVCPLAIAGRNPEDATHITTYEKRVYG